jgi:hypothetical protein
MLGSIPDSADAHDPRLPFVGDPLRPITSAMPKVDPSARAF